MNSKRSLVISGVAVLAVLLSVTAFFAFPRSAKGAESIPVFGHILYSDSQFLAAKDPQPILAHGYIRYNDPQLLMAKDPQPILAHGYIRYNDPQLLAAKDPQPRLANGPIRYGESRFDQIAPQVQSAPDSGANSQWVPGQEFIPVR